MKHEELRIDLKTREVHVGNKPIKLTRKEFDLLHYLASRPKRVVSRQQLMADIWGDSTAHSLVSRNTRTILLFSRRVARVESRSRRKSCCRFLQGTAGTLAHWAKIPRLLSPRSRACEGSARARTWRWPCLSRDLADLIRPTVEPGLGEALVQVPAELLVGSRGERPERNLRVAPCHRRPMWRCGWYYVSVARSPHAAEIYSWPRKGLE